MKTMTQFLFAALTAGLALASPAAPQKFKERDFKPFETSRPRPADFDAYWDGELARQRKEVPLSKAKVRIVEVPEKAPKGFRLYDVMVPALGERPVHGYLTVPVGAKPKTLPLYVRFGGAGTKSAPIYKFDNAISFSTNPNGCENGRDEAFYKEFFDTVMKSYEHRGWASRETCFFHDQILRTARALEWAKTRPEWNGRDIAVEGKSMGGAQVIFAAAVDPDVTLCAPEDPGMCDHAGEYDPVHPRKPGWPQIMNHYRHTPQYAKDGLDEEKFLAITDYFDNCFFASRISKKCKTFYATGFCDGTCPAEGVFIAYQNTPGEKQMTVDSKARHCQTNNRAFEKAWQEVRDRVKK